MCFFKKKQKNIQFILKMKSVGNVMIYSILQNS